ncbi:biotin--[acetyl-CoA-carboxylase] ligase [Actinoallomurus bryophytorum]|uniref:biotin--[biotin carboxyl-carrier protein] ligase n=1 Tax=Actinoallomurus bryophytorum TaxID=1490222 RepID=A0A543CMD3_9ACTN|nr:biotin--[acetyl-CoA-carboxylase] ligase [Actinoallomurus bryophytorum]TQL98268.1 BirA family biotin operon repressor/biotin-[acetyl-CoA-carboxylase] ligase [Actinoallomurus bryophytorum]
MSHSPYSDLDRPPLSERSLTRALVRPGGLWREIRVVEETGSTNADLADLARGGAAPGLVLVAEAQTSGRGRMGRAWTAPPRSGLSFSVLLPPEDSVTRLGWLPLVAGVAVVSALRGFAEVEGVARGRMSDAVLKWPNDVLIGERKLAGILAERVEAGVIIGIGLNVSLHEDELPVPTATSLAIEGAPADRDPLLRAILRELAARHEEFQGGEAAVRETYRELCATVGRQVRVELPDGSVLTGEATDIEEAGRLVVQGPNGEHLLSAGDVVHVR